MDNFAAHPDAVDMGTTKRRWVRSNSRDSLLGRKLSSAVDIDCTAGGTIVLTVDEQLANRHIRLTGTPGAGFTLEIADGDGTFSFENTTAQTATLDTNSGATPPITLLTLEIAEIQVRGIEMLQTASSGVQVGAMMADGSVEPTALINLADFILARPKLKDVSLTVTSPTSSSGTLVLDMENGNFFNVTLDEAITTLTLDNPPNKIDSGILLEDGSGVLLLENGTDILLKETTDQFGVITLIARQDGTGGWAITWPSNIKWEQGGSSLLLEDGLGKLLLEDGSGILLLESSGFSPAQTLDPNAIDWYTLMTLDAGTTWYGLVRGLDMK